MHKTLKISKMKSSINKNILSGLITFISLIIITSGVKAQQSEEETDNILLNIRSKIPANWNYVKTSSRIHLIRNDSIYILNENRIKAPKENRDVLNQRIQKYGQRCISKIIYRYEARWSKEDLKKANEHNSKLSKEIKKLPSKYNIEHLYNKSLSSKKGDVYTPTNDAEKIRVSKYEKEYKELMSKIIEVPTIHTEYYSLFVDEIQGRNDNNHVVFPEEASLEVYRILILVSELSEK